MIALVQRVKNARVTIDQKLYAEISAGFVVFLGIIQNDTESDLIKLSDKIIKLRIMNDPKRKMNLSITDTRGEILVVSQFTLAASLKGGQRPDFFTAMEPKKAELLYSMFVEKLKSSSLAIKTGIFSAYMEVELVNDGPATFILDSRNL